jgi:hypothetical protein
MTISGEEDEVEIFQITEENVQSANKKVDHVMKQLQSSLDPDASKIVISLNKEGISSWIKPILIC